MDPASVSNAPRLAICLLADASIYSRIGVSIRYLMVGLLDAMMVPVLVGPRPRDELLLGSLDMIEFVPPAWPLRSLAARSLADRIREQLETARLDAAPLVHALGGESTPNAERVAEAIDGDFVVTLLDGASGRGGVGRNVLAEAAAVTVPSESLRKQLLVGDGVDERVRCIRFGVPAPAAPTAFAASNRAPAIVYAGPLTDDACVDDLLRAFTIIRPAHPDAMLFLIGKGPADLSLRRLAAQLDIQSALTFTGWLGPAAAAMRGGDVFCLPSRGNCFSQEPVQALANGMTVIAAQDSLYDGLADNGTAWLFPQGDIDALAGRLHHALSRPAEARAVAARGQQEARTRYSVGTMVEGFTRLYGEIALRTRTLPTPGAR